jgi:hypothetical protein
VCLYATNPMLEGSPYVVHKAISAPKGDFLAPLTPVKNSLYGADTPTTSNVAVMVDVRFKEETVMIDQQVSIGADGSGYKGTSFMGVLYKEAKLYGLAESQHYGYASCHWLRHCDQAGEDVGSSCAATLTGVSYTGYCFKSDTGSLECGHLAALDNEYGEHPIAFDRVDGSTTQPFVKATTTTTIVASTPGDGPAYRCPPLSPAKGSGTYVSKRHLIGGCMISTDPSYDLIADVHIPAYCTTPTDYKLGCMFAGALNYDPAAKQSGYCAYKTQGCMSPTALNYNEKATESDGSCIEPTFGCTVQTDSYFGVASTTPGYKGGYVQKGTDKVPYDNMAVLNYKPTANVLEGCQVAIEGCMDKDAANYNPKANVNTNSWCIPKVLGCMLPYTKTAYAKDPVGSTNYNPTATEHAKDMCVIIRIGCTDKQALNYDPIASQDDGTCVLPIWGCLNSLAMNYGCDMSGRFATSACSGAGVNAHTPLACHYQGSLAQGDNYPPDPPAPPSPALPPGQPLAAGVTYKEVTTYDVVVTVAIIVDRYAVTPEVKVGIVKAFNSAMNLSPGFTLDEVKLIDGENNVFARRLEETPTTVQGRKTFATNAEAQITKADYISQSSGVTVGAVQTALTAETGISLTVITVPTFDVTKTTVLVPVPAVPTPPSPLPPSPPPSPVGPPSSSDSTGAIVGGVVGGIVALLIIAGALWYYKKKKSMKTTGVYPA